MADTSTDILRALNDNCRPGLDGSPDQTGPIQNGSSHSREEVFLQPPGAQRLRESEQRLRLALESGSLGTWDLDLASHRYVEISDVWKDQFGLSAHPDLEEKGFTQEDFLARLHPDDRDRIRDAAHTALRDDRDYHEEYRCIWTDGSQHWISASGRLLYDETGTPRRMIGMTQDITDRKAREAERERALAEAYDQADRDALTNLWNHRAFHHRLQEEMARAQRDGTRLAIVLLDLDNFKFFNDVYGHVTGDTVLRSVADKLQAISRPYDTVARFGGDEFALLLPGAGNAAIIEIEARLQRDLKDLVHRPAGAALAIPISISLGTALFPTQGTGKAELVQQADERLRRAKTGEAGETNAGQIRSLAATRVDGFSMLDALVTAVDNKDRYTRRHSKDVMEYSLMIARVLNLDADALHTVAVAALLHDVGKIGIPDAILRKPGELTAEEFAAVRQHPQMGAIMVTSVPGLEDTLDAVRHHHERWDGGGYPAGLKEEETPLFARLMAVADAFSAMTTDRPYRKGMDRESAFALLSAGSGTQWDGACVEAFLDAWHHVCR